MRRIGIAVASLAVFAAAGAQAAQKIADVSGTVNNDVTIYGITDSTQAPGQTTNDGSGGSWDSYVDIGRTAITFESSNATSGYAVSVTSSSVVTLGIENTTGHAVDATLHSTITPAGFGFYIADQSGLCGGNIYTGCGQANGGVFQDLQLGDGAFLLGTASFQFEIFDGDNPNAIYSALGSLELKYDLEVGVYLDRSFSEDALGLPPVLTTEEPSYFGNVAEFGYLWDAKEITLNLATLASGEMRNLVYKTTVTSSSYAGCTIEVPFCLVSYAGFGDPIGRGGGIDAAFLRGDFGSFDEELVSGVNFTPATYNIPTFDDETGVISFTLQQQPTGAVPEPGLWATLILGFGLAGGTLRRVRRSPSAAA